jgi:hypothetical protein
MCTRKPSFSTRTPLPSRSTLGPLKLNSTEASVVLAAGNDAGEDDWVTLNCSNPVSAHCPVAEQPGRHSWLAAPVQRSPAP